MKSNGRSPKLILALATFACILLTSCGGGGTGSPGGGTGGYPSAPLAITTTSLPESFTGLAYDQTLTASGGKLPITWSYSGFFPSGLTLSSNGRITGTVTNAVFGDVLFQAQDSSSPPQSVQKSVRMTFRWGLQILGSIPTAHAQAPYNAVIQASSAVDSTTWKVISGALPAGLSLTNPTTTQVSLSGVPAQAGQFTFTIQVKDNGTPQQVATASYTLVVDSVLAIAPATLPDGLVGAPYSAILSVPNGTPPYTWSAARLPAGLTLNQSTGVISGTPTGVGDYSTDVSVVDSSSPQKQGSQSYRILIVEKLEIGSTLPDALLGRNYFATLNVYGGKSPVTWTILSGALPPGITFTAQIGNCTFTGTPTQLGDYSFTIQAKDSATTQQVAEASITLKVKPTPIQINESLPTRLPLGVPYEGYSVVTGGIPPYTWNISSGSLPPGLTLDSSTGRLSGTPNAEGYFVFTLEVTDSMSQKAFRDWPIRVTKGMGRNDSLAKATPISDGELYASISPYSDPSDNPSPVPDTDFYEIIGNAGSVMKAEVFAAEYGRALDPLLELVDANGVRLNFCRLPGDTTENYNSNCVNDDIEKGVVTDSALELKVPGEIGTQSKVYAHVLDYRGDARPDMRYRIRVSGSVAHLAITTTSVGTLATDTPIEYPLSTFGGTTPFHWSVESGSLPPGLSVTADGKLSGTPSAAGDYQFVLRVTDSASPAQTAMQSLSVKVRVRPTITTTSLPDAYTGVAYSYQLTASDGTPPFYWTDEYCNKADCIQLHPTPSGLVEFMPRTPGTFTASLALQDRNGFWARKDLSITVHPGPLNSPATTLGTGRVGRAYQDFVNDTVGGTPPYSFNVASGAIPPGLTFLTEYGSGVLMGTPTQAGRFTFTVTVVDSGQPVQSTTAAVTVNIAD